MTQPSLSSGSLIASSTGSLSDRAVYVLAAWIGAVFFYKDHLFDVSRYDEWAPWAAEGAVASGGNVLKGAALGSIGLLGAYLLATKTEPSARPRLALLVPMLGYLAWCGASFLWTEDRGATARQLVVLFSVALGAFGIASRTQPQDLLKMLLLICGTFVAIGLFAELSLGTLRPWASGYRFAGTVHPNAQGGVCAILVISSLAYLLARGDERRAGASSRRAPGWKERLPAILLAVGTAGLLLAKSRTCVAGCLAACAILIAFRVSARTKATAGFVVAWAAVAGIFALGLSGVDLAAEAQAAFYMGRAEESEALSGRLPIWTELSSYVAERPWTGYGYAAFWTEDRIDTISRDIMWTFREAHSTFFEILLSVGGVGLSLYLASALVAATIATRRALRGDGYGSYFLALMVFLAITAITESSVVWPCLETMMLGTALFQIALRRGESLRPSTATAGPAAPGTFPAGAPAS